MESMAIGGAMILWNVQWVKLADDSERMVLVAMVYAEARAFAKDSWATTEVRCPIDAPAHESYVDLAIDGEAIISRTTRTNGRFLIHLLANECVELGRRIRQSIRAEWAGSQGVKQ